MAKSIRSKWKRKCRAVKRERYGKKELDRLKKVLGVETTNKADLDAAMSSINDIAEVIDASTIEKEQATEEQENEPEDDLEMDIDGKRKIYNTKTYKDQNGAYPVWLHPRKMKKTKKKQKVAKRLKNKSKKKAS